MRRFWFIVAVIICDFCSTLSFSEVKWTTIKLLLQLCHFDKYFSNNNSYYPDYPSLFNSTREQCFVIILFFYKIVFKHRYYFSFIKQEYESFKSKWIDKGHETGSCEEYNINSEETKM